MELRNFELSSLSYNEKNDLKNNWKKHKFFEMILFDSIPKGFDIDDSDVKLLLPYLKDIFRFKKSGLYYTPQPVNSKITSWYNSFMNLYNEAIKVSDDVKDEDIFKCIDFEEKSYTFWSSHKFAKNPYLTQLGYWSEKKEENKTTKIIQV